MMPSIEERATGIIRRSEGRDDDRKPEKATAQSSGGGKSVVERANGIIRRSSTAPSNNTRRDTGTPDIARRTQQAASRQKPGTIASTILNNEAARATRQDERIRGEEGSIRRAVYNATENRKRAERSATRSAAALAAADRAAVMDPKRRNPGAAAARTEYDTARQGYLSARDAEYDARQGEWLRRWDEKYGSVAQNADYAEKSTAVNQNERDTTYRYINQIGGFDRLVEQAGQNAIANPMAKYALMTPEERASYNYIYNTQGIDSAREYLEGLEYGLNARQVQQTADFYAEQTRKDPVAMSAVTPLVNLMGGAGQVDVWAQAALKRRNDYKPVDYNRMMGAPSRFVSTVRETVSDDIGNPAGSFLYNTGMSIADFVAAALLGGGGGVAGSAGQTAKMAQFAKAALGNIPTTLIGMSAGTQAMTEAVERGATDRQAVGIGLAASIAEIISEKVSLGAVLKATSADTLAKFFVQMLKNAGVEGSEEGVTDIANAAADAIIMGDKNEWTRLVLYYQSQGMTPAEAQKQAFKDWGTHVMADAAAGALSGFLMGAGAAGLGVADIAISDTKAGRVYEASGDRAIGNLINENLKAREDTDARKLADRLQAKSEKGRRISARDLGRLERYGDQDTLLDNIDRYMGRPDLATRRTGGVTETAPAAEEVNQATEPTAEAENTAAAAEAMPAQEQPAEQMEMQAEQRMAAPPAETNEQTAKTEQQTAPTAETAPARSGGTTVQQAQEIARQENVNPATRRLDGTRAHPNAGLDYSHAGTAKYVNGNLSARDAAQLDAFAKQLGLRVRYAPYGTVAGGNANAMINGNEVVFEEGNENPYQFLAGHEFGHRMKQLSPETWNKFEDFAKNTEWGKERYEQTVKDYEARNMSLPDNVWEEVACDYAGRLLLDDNGEDSGLIGDLIRENRNDPNLLQRILEVLREIAEKLSGREKNNAQKAIGLLEDAYRAAVQENAQSETGVQTETEEYTEQPLVGEEALVPNEMLSIKSLNQDTAEGKMFQDLVAAKVMTQKEADALRDSLLDLLKYIEEGLAQQYEGVLTQDQILRLVDLQEEEGVEYEFDADGNIIGENDTRRFHPFKPNSDKLYKISLDYSTLCQKRVFMQAVIESLQEQEKKALSGQDVMTIRELLKKAKSTYSAIQVACAMCYVESRRMGAAKFINNFLYTGEIDGKHAVNRASIIKDYFAKKDLDGIMARVKEEQARYKTDVVGVPADASKKAMQKAIREKQLAWKAECGYPETYNGYNIEQRVASETAKKRWLRSRSLPENATEDQIKGVYGKEGVKQFRDVKPDEFALEAGKNARAEYDGLGNMNKFNEIAPSIRAEYKPTKAQDKVIARAMKLPESTFLTAKNLANLKGGDNVDQQIYAAFTEYVRTASRQKGLEEDVAYYYGDSRRGGTTVSDQFIESVNEENGMRFSSWSDAQVQHILDNMVAIIEMSVRNVMMHGYTKFPWIVDIFGNTGAMYNMSGVPSNTGLDENGNLEFDPTDSVPIEEAKKMRDKYPETAGIQCIGATVEHVRALLRSDFIDYVIPYHISGLSEKLRLMAGILGWTDFEKYQEASVNSSIKKGNKSTWLTDTIDKEHWHEEPVFSEFFVGYDTGMSGIEAMKASAQNYIRMCFERGMTPKFALFLDEENYWKLLIDRKMINQKTGELIKQKPVRPDFNFDSAKGRFKQELDDYLAFVQDNENNPEGKAPEQIALDVILKAKESGEFAAIEKSLQKSDENTKRPSKADTAALAEAKSRSYQEAADRVWEKRRESDAAQAEELSRLADEKVKQQVAILNNTMLANMAASSAQQTGTKLSVKPVGQAVSSAGTSIKQVPALFKNKNVTFGDTNIDIGGGRFDLATNYLRERGTKNMVFDPYNRTAAENTATLRFLQNGGKADTVTCANVLNVIAEPEARANVILQAAKSIKPDGTAYFMVYEGDGSGIGKKTSAGWQNNRRTAEYVKEIRKYFQDVQRKGKLIVATEPNDNLPKASWETQPGQAVRFSVKSTSPFAPTYLPDARKPRKTEPAQARPKDFGKLVLPDARKKASIKSSNPEELQDLIDRFGAMERGEKPYRDIEVPRRTEKNRKVFQTARTILEAESTPEDMVPDIQKLIADGKLSYSPYSDKEAIADARDTIQYLGWDEALRTWLNDVKDGIVTKKNTTLGWLLYDNAASAGDTETALNVLMNMVQHQHNAAQALQATRILKTLRPETQLYQISKSVKRLQDEINNKYGKRNAPELKIDEDLAAAFINAKTQKERDNVTRAIYRDIGRQLPVNFVDRWTAWRYLAMLGNPRTHVRNILGNAGFVPLVATKNLTAAAIETIVDRVSGGNLDRTKAIGKGTKRLMKAAWGDYENVVDAIQGVGKYQDGVNANKEIREGMRIFGNTKWEAWNRTGGKALEWLRRRSGDLLNKEDAWFSRPHYAFALAQYAQANGISPEQIASGEGIDEARAYAILEAQKATYRDANQFSDFVSRLGRKTSKESTPVERAARALVEGVLPFRRTPANILARGFEYSPLGLMKTITADTAKVKNGKMTGAEFIDHISAGLTGTGMLALGLFLAAQGLIRGHGGDDDKEKELEELQGHQEYALEFGDGTSMTLDWLAPEALPFFIGVNLYELSAKEGEQTTMADLLTAIGNVTEPMLQMSCLQSLNAVLESVGYAKSGDLNAITSAMASAATSYLTQAQPTILGQLERATEDRRYTTFTEKDKFLTPDMQYAIGRASARTPGWDYRQIPYIDAWGREELTGTPLMRVVNNFLNPAYMSKINETDMEEELVRLYESTGVDVFPDRAQRSFKVDGEDKILTPDEYVQYATLRGQTAYQVITQMVGSRLYRKLDDDERAEAIDSAYTYAQETAQAAISSREPASWIVSAQGAAEIGIDPSQYIIGRQTTSDIHGIPNPNSSTGGTIQNSAGLQKMEAIYKAMPNLTEEQYLYLFDAYGVGKSEVKLPNGTKKSAITLTEDEVAAVLAMWRS